MIDFISGTLVSKKPTSAVVEAGGIGYRILIPTSTFEALPAQGKPVRIITHHHVREDAILLYGFSTDAERDTFELMIGVSGVGPKLAMAVLSAMRPMEFRDRVLDGDVTMLTRIPGVGRKTAERMIVELRDRFDRVDLDAADAAPASTAGAFRSDALAALEALGLSRTAADKAVRSVLQKSSEVSSAEELIRLALRE